MSTANDFSEDELEDFCETIEEMDRLQTLSNSQLVAEGLMFDFPDEVLDEICSRLDPGWAYRKWETEH